MNTKHTCLRQFRADVSAMELPQRFTFPFSYEPHPLARLAACELQEDLLHAKAWNEQLGFGEEVNDAAEGKMFGVLVVKTADNELGWLAAFSGKLAASNHHAGFVPPVYDILSPEGFFRKEETRITQLNTQLEALETAVPYLEAQQKLAVLTAKAAQETAAMRQRNKTKKMERDIQRAAAKTTMDTAQFQHLDEELRRESALLDRELKRLKKSWQQKIELVKAEVKAWEEQKDALKKERRYRSATLQNQLFEAFLFLNQEGAEKSLRQIFGAAQPPAGAGECAAPRLLQYAFQQQWQPLALAEFWWGATPPSAIRRHGYFYPACRSKCEPILGYMLAGMQLDPNPVLAEASQAPPVTVIYEDDHLLLIHKPPGLLSVPGKTIRDSVQWRMQQRYPKATGPMIVHRLDMATSGLMVIAKREEIYHHLQQQFIRRQVKKRYVALLDGLLEETEGWIDLPLRVDLEDRPRQLVCYEYGKSARSRWVKLAVEKGRTRVHFFPVTGRTHQLRVHAAHHRGLNTPIVGDKLYGQPGPRLHLHAEQLEFTHPITQQWILFRRTADF